MRGYRRNRNNKKSYFKIFLIVIISIFIIVFTGYSLKKERSLNLIEKIIKDIGVTIGETLYAPIKFMNDKIEVNKEKEDIYKKYKALQKNEENYDQISIRIEELEKENKELKSLLNINSSLTDYDKINAAVVSRDVGYWYDKLVINKGEKDGVETRMAVVINSGVVGYVSEVSNHTSNVQLLTTKTLKNKVSVKISLENGEYANGLLIGYDDKSGVYSIEGISYSGTIPTGAMVTTTGLGDNFPSGIFIGHVGETTTDNFDLGKIVEVIPSVNFDDINSVTLLKRKDNEK